MSKSITLKNISYNVGERVIFSNVSIKCDQDERLCVIGENGAGKSTLLKIIAGQLEPENGLVQHQGHIRAAYIPQEFDANFNQHTVSEYIKEKCGDALKGKVYQFASRLGLSVTRIEEKKCGALSGGQQKILVLSTGLALNPDFILLDEPENHIDIVSRVALIDLLQEYNGGVIFISHDRKIIDSIASKIGELHGGTMHISEGDYQDYIDARLERIGGMQRSYDAETKRIKQLEAAVRILGKKAFRGGGVALYQRKKAELAELKGSHKDEGRPDIKQSKIKIKGANGSISHDGKLICRATDMAFRYEGAKGDMLHGVHFEIRSGQHIVLLGRNGSGKSTFLKCLTGEHAPTEGEVRWIEGMKFSYFDQHAKFDPEQTPMQIAMHDLNLLETEARAVLGMMRFDKQKADTKIKYLSGGERMRVRFALVFGKKAECIIFDEPTNNLDEVTWEIFLSACKQSKVSILLVTHDYEFIEEFEPDYFLVMNGQGIDVRHKDLEDIMKELK